MLRAAQLMLLLALLAMVVVGGRAMGTESQAQAEVAAVKKVLLGQQHVLDVLSSPENRVISDTMNAAFDSLDHDQDGHVSFAELSSSLEDGLITELDHEALQTFDLDENASLSRKEFLTAPLSLAMIESQDADLEYLDHSAPGISLAETGAKRHHHHRGFVPPPPPAVPVPAPVPVPGPPAVVPGTNPWWNNTFDTYWKTNTWTQYPKYPQIFHPPAKKLPITQFGVPSVSDEECAFCQYLVQKIQNGLVDRIQNPPPADSKKVVGSEIDGHSAAVKNRQVLAGLTKIPGGRGAVRVTADEVTSYICSPNRLPLLFAPYCSTFTAPNTISAIRTSLFFNLPVSDICFQSRMCRDDSYLTGNAGVHSSRASLYLNSQRGICGMLGGGKDRFKDRDGVYVHLICQAKGALFRPLAPP